ncbi:glycosyltransferase [Candidatus Venteria ishoeyi]|uniref:Glycosyl transferases group 1 n=1 Tax=Candidatus Venteria ishoeyi TaxID=1899563 RepID=A0A1H6F7S7_9GAMM|nr:glycosyltransferase [Candidatus Venteria ishoeyi]SEH05613.1 Glycosyl transferases group 1 [Candidatus Venteria ishoeyi]
MAKINLLICGHDLKFLQPFIRRCQQSSQYNVKILGYSGHYLQNEVEVIKGLNWAHVIFCEWALGGAVWFSQCKRPEQILIVRLHLQEIQARDRTEFIWSIDWSKVNRLILITHHIYDWFSENFPAVAPRCSLIYNPIPAKEKLNHSKNIESRFVLGLVGIVPARKRLDLAVAILRKLLNDNSNYILRIKGSLPTDYKWMEQRKDEIKWYTQVFHELEDLKKSGHLYFDPHNSDMDQWYKQIGHILSVSDFEGSHQAVAEAMASGSVPCIRNWIGAGRIYPNKYVGSAIDGLVNLIKKNTMVEKFEKESEFCRQFAHSQFDEADINDQLEAIIHQELLQNSKPKIRHLSNKKTSNKLPTFIILAYIPIGSRNGYRIRVEQEITILKRQGCKVHLACLVPAQNYKKNATETLNHAQEFISLGCEVSLLPIQDFFNLNKGISDFSSIIENLHSIIKVTNATIIHAEALYCSRIAYWVKQSLTNVIFSIDWHGIIPEESRMGGAHKNRIMALEKIENKLLQESDLNIFVSKEMNKHYQHKYTLDIIKYITVPCCVSDTFFIESNATVKLDEFSENHLIFGYIGSMADWQCGSEMISLFAQLYQFSSDCRFILLVPKSDHTKVYEYIKHAGLPEHSVILTEVSHHEVSAWMQKFHVGVLLRRSDPVNQVSSPTKYAEYLASGVPVLMTDGIGDYSERVKKEDVGLVLPVSVLENKIVSTNYLAKILEIAKSSKLQRSTIKQKCQDSVQNLLWEPVVKIWLNDYENIFKSM